jgi:8-oxo-dGTP pyrophosphatase MutT (NUDIX family)
MSLKDQFINQYSESKLKGLPGDEAHKLVLPINRPLPSKMKDLENYWESAVGILLYDEGSSLKSVLIERPEYDGVHSKQIAFPGGKKDATDPDLEFTARRECEEEIAIPKDSLELIGSISPVHIPVSRFTINPYIFYVEHMPVLIPEPREVADIIHFDVDAILKEDNLTRTNVRISSNMIRKDVPCFMINGKVVWGATAMLLSELRSIIKDF